LQAPAGTDVVRPSARRSHRNQNVLDVHDVCYELGISLRTLERELRRRGSKFPQPFQRAPGTKRQWMLTDVAGYRTALAFLSRTGRSSDDHE
jgi:hypothetical protein